MLPKIEMHLNYNLMLKSFSLLAIVLFIGHVASLQQRGISQSSVKSLKTDIGTKKSSQKELELFEMSPEHFLNSVFYQANGTMVFYGSAPLLKLKLDALQDDFKGRLQNLLAAVILGQEHRYFEFANVLMQYASMVMLKMQQICNSKECQFIRDLQQEAYPEHYVEYEEYWETFVQHHGGKADYWSIGSYELVWDEEGYFRDQETVWRAFEDQFNENLFVVMSSTLSAACLNFDFLRDLATQDLIGVGFDEDTQQYIWTEYATDQVIDWYYNNGYFYGASNPVDRLDTIYQKLPFVFGVAYSELFKACNSSSLQNFTADLTVVEQKVDVAYSMYEAATDELSYKDLWTAQDEQNDTSGHGLLNFTRELYQTFDKSFGILAFPHVYTNQELVVADVSLQHQDKYTLLKALRYKRDWQSLSDQVVAFMSWFNPTDQNSTEIFLQNERYEVNANDLYELYTLPQLFEEEGFNLTWEITLFQDQYMSLLQNITSAQSDLLTFATQVFRLFTLMDQYFNPLLQGECGYPESYKDQNELYSENVDDYYHCKLQYSEVIQLKGLRIASYQIMYLMENVDLLTYLVKDNNERFSCHRKYLSYLSELDIYEDYEDAYYYIVTGANCLMYIGEHYRGFKPNSDLSPTSDLYRKYSLYYNLSSFEYQDSLLAPNGNYQMQNSAISSLYANYVQPSDAFSRARSLESMLMGGPRGFEAAVEETKEMLETLYELYMQETQEAREQIVSSGEQILMISGVMQALTGESHFVELHHCVPIFTYTPLLEDLLKMDFETEKLADVIDLFDKLIPLIINVDYLLQNCKVEVDGADEDEKKFDEDILALHRFVQTQYQTHSNDLTFIGQLLVEFDADAIQETLKNLERLVDDAAITSYHAIGFEFGRFLIQALGRDEKEDIVSKWFKNAETAPILNSVAILSDELEMLNLNPMFIYNLETKVYEEPMGYAIGEEIGDKLRKIYSNIQEAIGNSTYQEFKRQVEYTGEGIRIGRTLFTSDQAESEINSLYSTQEAISEDLKKKKSNKDFAEEAYDSYADMGVLDDLFDSLSEESAAEGPVQFFGDVILDCPTHLKESKRGYGSKYDLMYGEMSLAVIPEIGNALKFIQNLFCFDWC